MVRNFQKGIFALICSVFQGNLEKISFDFVPEFSVNTNLSSDQAPSSIDLNKIASCSILTDLYFDSTNLMTAFSLSRPGFTAKITSDSSINSLRIQTALFFSREGFYINSW